MSSKALEVRYGPVPAVRDISLKVGRGEVVGLIGPNGAGKSTTLHAVMGAIPAHAGDIRLDGQSIRGRSPEAISRAGVALVPEGRRIFGDFTVEENLRLGLAGRKRNGSRPARPGVRALSRSCTSSGAARRGLLSGGQQQQLAIGRALVADPELLLLDEPSLGLAPMAVDGVFETLRSIRERGVTILLVEQRAIHTVALCDRTHVLVGGELKMILSPADAADKSKIVAAYLSA